MSCSYSLIVLRCKNTTNRRADKRKGARKGGEGGCGGPILGTGPSIGGFGFSIGGFENSIGGFEFSIPGFEFSIPGFGKAKWAN